MRKPEEIAEQVHLLMSETSASKADAMVFYAGCIEIADAIRSIAKDINNEGTVTD